MNYMLVARKNLSGRGAVSPVKSRAAGRRSVAVSDMCVTEGLPKQAPLRAENALRNTEMRFPQRDADSLVTSTLI